MIWNNSFNSATTRTKYISQHLNPEYRYRILAPTMSPVIQNPVNQHDGCGSSSCNCGASCACKPGECNAERLV
ncbi:hypothetical protein F5888DRAFT_1112573 [Russula emetica]|nr:hypothetical protein F5888DRAFT_1112573 [Russula emetica]